jgi:hypothetical protein
LSPILVRPVREQLEHDRVIRLLQAKLKRKHEVTINVGDEQTSGIKIGPGQMFPDLVLSSTDKAHRLEALIEVETGESVNHLEAMAQWAHFGRARAAFYLYVPASAVDQARRLCLENDVSVSEIWSYHSLGDQTRFTLVAKLTQKHAPRPVASNGGDGVRPAAKAVALKPNGAPKPKGAAKPPAKAAAKAKARPAAAKAAAKNGKNTKTAKNGKKKTGR